MSSDPSRDEGAGGARGRRRKPAWREPETVHIESLSHDGRGVTHVEGKAVFVPRALPGEDVRIQRRRRHRRHDDAALIEVLSASPQRVSPPCEYFDICGGCSLQHLAPADQIAAKERVLLENLRRIGRVAPAEVLAPLSGDAWHNRRRARLAVRWVRAKGRVLVGFRERLKPVVADMHRCEILAHPVDALLDPLSALIGGLTVRERVPQIEVAVGEACTVLVLRHLDPVTADDLDRLRRFEAAHGVQLCLQPGNAESIVDLAGGPAPVLHYTLPDFDVRLAFLPSDFVQINAALNRAMVTRAVALLAPAPQETVLDLFAGLGNFTLPLARRAGRVVAVEGDAGLVTRLRANAAANALDNVEAHVADLSGDVSDLPWAKGGADALLLDPSRAGADGVLPMVDRWRPSRICYVSCHPGTLARDAEHLVHRHGYRLTKAGVMDMFPHTAHVESIALFERKGS
jgi:23S rRNA (uracil1939-C5)-methyltransferase